MYLGVNPPPRGMRPSRAQRAMALETQAAVSSAYIHVGDGFPLPDGAQHPIARTRADLLFPPFPKLALHCRQPPLSSATRYQARSRVRLGVLASLDLPSRGPQIRRESRNGDPPVGVLVTDPLDLHQQLPAAPSSGPLHVHNPFHRPPVGFVSHSAAACSMSSGSLRAFRGCTVRKSAWVVGYKFKSFILSHI